ncbi:19513_t:CDS:2, partial [Rhizophagus irregularis]
NSEFITVKATIFPGISDTSYSEAEKLQKLLISRKDDIDHILELQPVYAIGADFQKNSTRPCITCWVAKSLDITVLECLETIFEDQFEVIYKIVVPLNINENNNQNLNTNRIYISSKVNAEVINSEFLQDFNISANLWAEIIPFEEDIKILEYDVDVNVCGVGDMLSNQCSLFNGKGLGYLLHSVEVHISPLPNNGNNLFGLKGTSQPRQINRNIEISKGNEKSYEGKVGISKTPGVDFTGPNTKGERWLYQYIDNNLDKDGSHRENFVPGVHSSQWFIYEGMHGFCITITQVLRCEITCGWRRFLPNTKTLLQKFPIMAHNLKVTFNDLENFNCKLKNLNKTCYYNSDDIGVIIGSNENENKIVNKPQNIQNLVGKIDRSLELK